MGKLIDLTGQKFGRLTVLSRGEDAISKTNPKRKYPRWNCRCDCGNEILVRGASLREGKTQSCGCLQKEKASQYSKEHNFTYDKDKEFIGHTFGQLTPISRAETHGSVTYVCQCSCGNTIQATRAELLQGIKTACRKPGCNIQRNYSPRYKDITGQRFGKLVALYPTGVNNRGQMKWMFQCDCGNQKEIEGGCVTRGNTLSCGCLKQSHGELIIEQILQANNIEYRKEVHAFNYSDGEMSKARFDFEVEGKYFIEFDGQQHFKSNNRGWNTPELVEKYKKHDVEKNNWCKEHNIPLIRIPYTHIRDICLEDLQLETSKFILT